MKIQPIPKKILITGTNGSGKTFEAVRLAKHINEGLKVPVYVYAPDPYDFLRIAKKDKSSPVHIINQRFHRSDFENICKTLIETQKRRQGGMLLVIDEFQLLYDLKSSYKDWARIMLTRHRNYRIGIIAISHRVQNIHPDFANNVNYNIYFKHKPSATSRKHFKDTLDGLYEKVVGLDMKKYEKVLLTESTEHSGQLVVYDKNNIEVKEGRDPIEVPDKKILETPQNL